MLSKQENVGTRNISNIDLSQDLTATQLKELSKLFSVLSKVDSLTIFLHSKQGLKSSIDNLQNIGLSRKKYYTRLKQLVNSGLIKKHHGTYYHTTMGKFVYENIFSSFLYAMKNANQMKMIDILKNDLKYSEEEISNIIGLVMNTRTNQSSE